MPREPIIKKKNGGETISGGVWNLLCVLGWKVRIDGLADVNLGDNHRI